ncbi:MAG: hypothetical protein Q7S18_01420 [bacterium]|nr:hypothetical protein [bacterium]
MNWNQRADVNFKEGNNRNAAPNSSFGMPRGFSSEKKTEIREESLDKSNSKIVKVLDSIIKFSIFAIFFGLPLFFTGFAFQGITFEKQIYFYFWILLALVAWGSKSGYIGEMKIRRTSLDIPIFVFWLFYLIATIFSVDRWHSFAGFFGDPSRGFISISAMIVLYYLILSNFSENFLKLIMKAIIFSGAIAVIWELLKVFNLFLPQSFLSSSPISTFGSLQSSAIFACFLVLIFLMTILKVQTNENLSSRKKTIYSILLSLLIAASLIIVLVFYNYLPIFGRFPLVGLVAGTAFFLIFVLAKIVRPKDAWKLLPMVVFILVLAFLMIGSVNIARISLPFNVSVPYNTSLEIAKNGLKDNFFIGSGPASYGYVFSKNLPQNFDNMNLRFFEGEGVFLESLASIGIIGTILLTIMLLTFLGTSMFLLYREKEKNKVYSLGMMAATLVLLVNIMIAQTEGSILILLAMMAAVTTGTLFMESDVKDRFWNFSLKASPKFALTLAFISLLIFASVAFLFVFFGKIYIADIYMGKAVRLNNISENGSVSMVIRAIQLNNKEGRYFTRLGQEYMVLTNEEMLKGEKDRDVNKIQFYLSSAVQAGVRGRDMMKSDVTAAETLAQIYENSGMYLAEGLDLAEQGYKAASELEPNNPNFYVRLGQIKTKMAGTKEKPEDRKKLIEDARDLFQKSIDIRNTFDSGYYNLALAQEALGQMDDSIDNMTKAVRIQGNNINYVFNLARLFQARGKNDDNKIAESLFKQILGVNDKEINTHFNLGLLYEKTNRKSEAVDEYKKVSDLLPEGSDATKEQLDKMISNIKKGIENTPENLGLTKTASESNAEENSSSQENAQPSSSSDNANQ